MNRLLPLLAPLLLVGCLGGKAYRQMRRDARSPAASDYYLHEISRPLIPAAVAPTDPVLTELQARLQAAAKQGQERDAAAGSAQFGLAAAMQKEAAARNADPAALAAALKGPLALPLFLALVHERNPAIAAARRDVRAALLRYPQATALDDILVQYNAFTKQLDTRLPTQPQQAMMAMQFPYPDVAALLGQVVALEVDLARIGLDQQIRDVLTEARTAWFTYAYLHAAIAITRESIGLLGSLTDVVRARYGSDQALYSDVLSAQMELAVVAEEEASLRDQLGASRAALNALLDRAAEAELGEPEQSPDMTVVPGSDEVAALALRQRQELLRQRVSIRRMETMVDMASRMAVPDPTVGASYLETRMKTVGGAPAAGAAMDGMAAGAFDPQPRLDPVQAAQYGRENAYIRETAARIAAMRQMLADMENQTRTMVHARWAAMATAARRVRALYRTSQIPLARQALATAETAYRSGKVGFITYIDVQRALLRYQLEEEAARRDLREGLARLEQIAGVSLPVMPLPSAAAAKESAP